MKINNMINWNEFTGYLFDHVRSENGWDFIPIDVWNTIREFVKYDTVVNIYDTFIINYNKRDGVMGIIFMIKYDVDNVSVILFRFTDRCLLSMDALSAITEKTFINLTKNENSITYKISEFCGK